MKTFLELCSKLALVVSITVQNNGLDAWSRRFPRRCPFNEVFKQERHALASTSSILVASTAAAAENAVVRRRDSQCSATSSTFVFSLQHALSY